MHLAFPNFGKCGDDTPNLAKPELWSSYPWIPPKGESVPETDAATLTRLKKSMTDGRSVRWVCQLSSSSFQISSEMPGPSALAGLEGFPPPKTFNATSDEGSFPNGSVPVSTYTRRIGMRVHAGYPVVRA